MLGNIMCSNGYSVTKHLGVYEKNEYMNCVGINIHIGMWPDNGWLVMQLIFTVVCVQGIECMVACCRRSVRGLRVHIQICRHMNMQPNYTLDITLIYVEEWR